MRTVTACGADGKGGRLGDGPRHRSRTVGAVGAASLVLHGNCAPGWRMLTDAPG
jgi:hypothetical protein